LASLGELAGAAACLAPEEQPAINTINRIGTTTSFLIESP
jgi:hypothetical protein